MTFTDEQIQALGEPLDESRVKQTRFGGRDADYLEAHDVIDRANEVFGYDGWSFGVLEVTTINAATREGEGTGALFMARVRVRVGDVVREDVGTNDISYRRDDGNATPDSFETSIKGAVSDGLKRCFRTFGAQFGNSLYDKDRRRAGVAQGKSSGTPPQAGGSTPSTRTHSNGNAPTEIKNVGDVMNLGRSLGMNPKRIKEVVGQPKDISERGLDESAELLRYAAEVTA